MNAEQRMQPSSPRQQRGWPRWRWRTIASLLAKKFNTLLEFW
jgi:hypothetical protein